MTKVLSVLDRIARVMGRVQSGQLVAGMILADERAKLTATKYAKLIRDAFTYQTRASGKLETKWQYPETTIGRWTNAGAVALVLGFTTGDDDSGEDLPPMSVLAPLYAILKTGKDLEPGDALDAIHQAVRDAWAAANETFESGKAKTLLLAVEAEVARRTKKKKKNGGGSDGSSGSSGNGSDGSDGGEVQVTYDPAAVVAARPIMDGWVKATATKLNVSQAKVRTIAIDTTRFAAEHGHAVLLAALMPETEDERVLKNEKNA